MQVLPWAFREGVCTTWFCKHNAGADGLQFWTAVKDYLFIVQRRLSEYALHSLGWDVEAVLRSEPRAEEPLSARAIDDQPLDDSDYSALWGDWQGREEEFYRRAFETVAALSSSEFEQIGESHLAAGEIRARTDTLEDSTLWSAERRREERWRRGGE